MSEQAKLFSFGGCVYRMQVHAQHASSFAMLATICSGSYPGPLLADIDYMHTSNLPQGRSLWLRRQIANPRLRWAISCDGDTTFMASDLAQEIELVTGNVAIGLAPVRIGGTQLCNLNVLTEELQEGEEGRASLEELARILEGKSRRVISGGFGLAVFNLQWFRRHWALPEPERIAITSDQDIELCHSVSRREGAIIALRVKTGHHAYEPISQGNA